MGVRVDPADLPEHLALQHQHNLNRGAEAEAQYAPIASDANMIAAPVRALGYFGGPVGASYAETKAQQIERAGGARQAYDPMAIGEQALVPVAVGAAGKLARGLRSPKPPSGGPTVPPQIAPVPQPKLKPMVEGSYFGPERRRSLLSPTQAAEEQIGRMAQRRRATDPLEGFTEGSFYRVTGREPLGNFIDTMDRTRRKP